MTGPGVLADDDQTALDSAADCAADAQRLAGLVVDGLCDSGGAEGVAEAVASLDLAVARLLLARTRLTGETPRVVLARVDPEAPETVAVFAGGAEIAEHLRCALATVGAWAQPQVCRMVPAGALAECGAALAEVERDAAEARQRVARQVGAALGLAPAPGRGEVPR